MATPHEARTPSPARAIHSGGALLAYFALTFAVTWGCWITIIRSDAAHSLLGRFFLYVGVFSPALVSLALTFARSGAPGVRALLGRLLPVPVAARWIAFALGYLLAVKLTAALLHWLVAGQWPRFDLSEVALIPFAILLSTPVQAGEELGWRGFALPRLAARFGLARASLLLGLVWATWHLPLFYLRDADTFGQSFVLYATQVVAISVAIAMLWARARGGLLLPMLFHASVNNTKDIVPSATPGAHGVFSAHASLLGWLGTAVLWACTIAILAWMARTERERASLYDEVVAPVT